MDQILQTTLTLLWPLLALVVVAAVAGAVLRSPRFKGWWGERRVQRMIREGLSPHEYVDLHNVTLPTEGGSTQIDHLIFSPYGVFVLETKNLKGWIFGTERQAEWTQKIHKNHSQKFKNPLRQNYLHTQTVKQLLQLPNEQVHSVVAFVGKSEFKTEMPAHVQQGGDFVDYILQFQQEVWGPEAMQEVIDRLEKLRLAPTRATQQAHVAHVQQVKERKAGQAADKAQRKKRTAAVSDEGVPEPSSAQLPIEDMNKSVEADAAAKPVKKSRTKEGEATNPAASGGQGAVIVTLVAAKPLPAAAARAAPTPQQRASAPALQTEQPGHGAAPPAQPLPQAPMSTPEIVPAKPVKYCPQCQSTLRKLRLQRGPLAGQVIYRCSNTALCQYVQPLPDAAPAGA